MGAIRTILVCAAVGLALTACAHTGVQVPKKPVPPKVTPPPANAAGTRPTPDAFCDIAKPLTLAINDTAETQAEIRAFNTVLAKRCGQGVFTRGK